MLANIKLMLVLVPICLILFPNIWSTFNDIKLQYLACIDPTRFMFLMPSFPVFYSLNIRHLLVF